MEKESLLFVLVDKHKVLRSGSELVEACVKAKLGL